MSGKRSTSTALLAGRPTNRRPWRVLRSLDNTTGEICHEYHARVAVAQDRLVEYFDSKDDLVAKCEQLAQMISRARHIIAFTGSALHVCSRVGLSPIVLPSLGADFLFSTMKMLVRVIDTAYFCISYLCPLLSDTGAGISTGVGIADFRSGRVLVAQHLGRYSI